MPKMPAFRNFLLKVLEATQELVRGSSIESPVPMWGRGFSVLDPPAASPPGQREILPINSEGALCTQCRKGIAVEQGSCLVRVPVKVKPGQRVTVIARPQRVAFKPEQVFIENGERWTVHDIRIGNRSQFAQSGDVPGAFFVPGASSAISFETAQTAMDVLFDVTYQGTEHDGEQFRASVVGAAVN